MEKEKVFAMSFPKVYGCLVAKAERKGRTKDEVDALIMWMTGYSSAELEARLEAGTAYKTFFDEAPAMNPKCELIKGSICGVRIEDIEDPTMKTIRRLDKLIDDLAKGKKNKYE